MDIGDKAIGRNIKVFRKYYFTNTLTLLLPLFFISLSIIVLIPSIVSFLQTHEDFSILNMHLKPAVSFVSLVFSIDFYKKENFDAIAIAVILAYATTAIAVFGWVANKIKKCDKGYIDFYVKRVNSIEPPILIDYDEEKAIPRAEQYSRLSQFLEETFSKRKHAFITGESGSGKSLLVKEYSNKTVKAYIISDYSTTDTKKIDDVIKKYKNVENITIIFVISLNAY